MEKIKQITSCANDGGVCIFALMDDGRILEGSHHNKAFWAELPPPPTAEGEPKDVGGLVEEMVHCVEIIKSGENISEDWLESWIKVLKPKAPEQGECGTCKGEKHIIYEGMGIGLDAQIPCPRCNGTGPKGGE